MMVFSTGRWLIQVAGEISKSRSCAESRTQCENCHALVHPPQVNCAKFFNFSCAKGAGSPPWIHTGDEIAPPAACPRGTRRKLSEDQRWGLKGMNPLQEYTVESHFTLSSLPLAPLPQCCHCSAHFTGGETASKRSGHLSRVRES